MGFLRHGEDQPDAQGLLRLRGNEVDRVEGPAVIPEAKDPLIPLVHDQYGKVMVLGIRGETVQDDIPRYLLNAQGDMAADAGILPTGQAELFRGAGRGGGFLNGGDLRFQDPVRGDPEILFQEQVCPVFPGKFPAEAADQHPGGQQRQELPGGEGHPRAGQAGKTAEDEAGQDREQGALQQGKQLGQSGASGGLPSILQRIIDAAGDQARGKQAERRNGVPVRQFAAGKEDVDQERGANQQEKSHTEAQGSPPAAEAAYRFPQRGAVLLVEEDPAQGEGNPAGPGGDAVRGVSDGHHDGIGGDRDAVAAVQGGQQAVHDEDQDHGGNHIHAGGNPAAEKLRDDRTLYGFPGEAEGALF